MDIDIEGIHIEDIQEVKRLREYYFKSFINGASDECFLLWVKIIAKILAEREHKPINNGL